MPIKLEIWDPGAGIQPAALLHWQWSDAATINAALARGFALVVEWELNRGRDVQVRARWEDR